jgi:hypothetical protein
VAEPALGRVITRTPAAPTACGAPPPDEPEPTVVVLPRVPREAPAVIEFSAADRAVEAQNALSAPSVARDDLPRGRDHRRRSDWPFLFVDPRIYLPRLLVPLGSLPLQRTLADLARYLRQGSRARCKAPLSSSIQPIVEIFVAPERGPEAAAAEEVRYAREPWRPRSRSCPWYWRVYSHSRSRSWTDRAESPLRPSSPRT